MKIEKLPSGSYRIRKMYNGQTYTVLFEHKPTQKEAMQAMAAELDRVQEKRRSMTFQAAAEQYIESKRNVLSPSTVRGYYGVIRLFPKEFLEKNLSDITALDVQAEINRMAGRCSPKTVRNHRLRGLHHPFLPLVLHFRLGDADHVPVSKSRKPLIPLGNPWICGFSP